MSASTRMSADAPALIAADWGTTSCRFALIGAGGTVLERATGRGILPVLADAAAGSDGPAASAAERAAVFEAELRAQAGEWLAQTDRKSTRLNSSHVAISYAVFCLKKKKK